jgi:hypothetical protein
MAWLQLLDFPDVCFRFDIVEVVISEGKTEIVILKNAFALPERYRL